MRILYISHSNAKDGSNIALLNIIKGMMARGHEVAVVTTAEEGPFLEELDKLKVAYHQVNTAMTIYPLNKNGLLYLPRIAYMLLRQRLGKKAVKAAIRSFSPDIVHTNVGPLGIGYEAAREMGIPHVWHQREYMDKIGMRYFPSYARFSRKTHSPNNHNVCITEGIFRHWQFDREKDTVIYDGVFNEKTLLSIPKREPQKTVLFVGRIEKAKNVMELLSAFEAFHGSHPDFSLHLIGDTPPDSIGYDAQCRQYVAAHGLQDAVHFLGRQNNIYEHMAKASMLVMSSQFEGFGFVTAEAMACGCPVIGKDTTGTKEQMDNGRRLTGEEIGLRYTTIAELAAAMHKVATTDTMQMCERARKTVLSLYTTQENAKHIEDFYKNILKTTETT